MADQPLRTAAPARGRRRGRGRHHDEADLEVSLPGAELQQSIGNQATGRLLRSVAMPVPAASAAARVLGSGAAGVRIRTETPISERPGALARAHGDEITLAPGAPQPGTQAGDFLLAHEAAHLRQQRGGGAPVGEREAEGSADLAAARAMLGGSPEDGVSATGPHYFEAPWHQTTLTNAMDSLGFTDAEQEEAYFNNWCRDFSQFFSPLIVNVTGVEGAFSLLQALSMHKFGRPATRERMGMYEAPAHIDNPLGQINDDFVQGNSKYAQKVEGDNAMFTNEDGTITAALPHYDPKPGGGPGGIADKFKLGNEGIPQYMLDSREYIKHQISLAIEAGRTSKGLQAVGNFSHTTEDLFAHSNWIEIAVGSLLEKGSVTLPSAQANDESTAAGRVALQVGQHWNAKQPLIETFAAEVSDAAGSVRPILQTGTFSGGSVGNDTLISLKHEVNNFFAENPFSKESKGSAIMDETVRYVLDGVDSSYNAKVGPLIRNGLLDALHSARTSSVGAALAGGAGELTSFAHSTVDATEHGMLQSSLSLLGVKGSDIPGSSAIGKAAGGAADLVGDAASGLAGLVGWAAPSFAGDAGAIASAVSGAAHEGAHLVQQGASSATGAIASGVNAVGKGATGLIHGGADLAHGAIDAPSMLAQQGFRMLESQIDRATTHLHLRDGYDFIKGARGAVDAFAKQLKAAAVRFLPDPIAVEFCESIDKATAALHETVRAALETVWNESTQLILGALDHYSRIDVSESDIHSKRERMGDQIVELQDKLSEAILASNPGPEGQEVANHLLTSMPVPQLLALVDSPAMAHLLTKLSRSDQKTLTDLRDQAMRAEQIDEVPDWAKSGASHSQTAKDHASSPFFPLAIKVANEADKTILGTLKEIWGGQPGGGKPAPGFEAEFDTTNAGEAGLTEAQKEHRAKFLENRKMGADAISTGTVDGPSPADELEEVADQLAEALSECEGSDQHHPLVIRIRSLITLLRERADIAVIAPPANEILELLHDGYVNFAGTTVLTTGQLSRAMKAVLEKVGDILSGFLNGPDSSEVFKNDQIARLNRMRGKDGAGAHIDGTFLSPTELAMRDEQIALAAPRDRIFLEVDRIFGHPYDSTWWQQTVIDWCTAHPDLLVEYIDQRNRGVAHHHH